MDTTEIYRNRANQVVKIRVPGPDFTYNISVRSVQYSDFEAVTSSLVEDGHVTFTMPYKHVLYDGIVQVKLTFFIEGTEYSHTENVQVVTPVFTPDEFSDADRKALGNADDAALWELERFIRHIIEAYTGASFGLSYGTRLAQIDKSVLRLNIPIVQFDGVSESIVTGSQALIGGVSHEIVESGYAVRVTSPGYHIKTDSFFLDGTRILNRSHIYVTGMFGYSSVPVPVREAARLLTGLFTCSQTLWRDRYIESLRNSDGSTLKYNEGAYYGTGSVSADQLLSKYVRGTSRAAVV